MTPDDLKSFYQGPYDFERKTKISHVSWYNWVKMGYIPLLSQIKIQHYTKGVLTADMSLLNLKTD